ncbi:MAG TPA: sulfite exporter TauE/SafE family protein [Candidatus Binataceae bacterium]|nr:sulfite exporter TauE/SafE family protein [Candidatus Binataceae bacterium]
MLILGGLLLLAVAAGFVGAISGLGGGVFIVPALVVLAKMPMRVAVGASLISVVATSAGASVAFVRDGWTNLKVAMVLECATVTGAVTGAYLAGVVPTWVLEGLFALMMLQSAYFSLSKQSDALLTEGGPIARKLGLAGDVPDQAGRLRHYEVIHVRYGAPLMVLAGVLSGLLGIGSGALKVIAMDQVMHMPLKVSSATSNFMIGVTAGAGALVFLSRGDVATTIAAPVALGVTSGALIGSRFLPYLKVEHLRTLFALILLLIAAEMGWRAVNGL